MLPVLMSVPRCQRPLRLMLPATRQLALHLAPAASKAAGAQLWVQPVLVLPHPLAQLLGQPGSPQPAMLAPPRPDLRPVPDLAPEQARLPPQRQQSAWLAAQRQPSRQLVALAPVSSQPAVAVLAAQARPRAALPGQQQLAPLQLSAPAAHSEEAARPQALPQVPGPGPARRAAQRPALH